MEVTEVIYPKFFSYGISSQSFQTQTKKTQMHQKENPSTQVAFCY